jgi:NAD(P)-dependent dehydrogenase (short-subunit alcohol dehydrogenase family)
MTTDGEEIGMKDRIVLVTGAGRGIGRAIAEAFAGHGAHVAVTARSDAELEQVVLEGRKRGGTLLSIVDDLADAGAPARVFGAVIKAFGRLDILINNAGVGSSVPDGGSGGDRPRPIVEFDDGFWGLTFNVNVTAPYKLMKLALPGMIERRWGRVISIASINASVPALHGAAYTASKHALVGLTKVAAIEAVEHGVTANAICPAATRSVLNDRRIQYDADRLGVGVEALERGLTPLGRRLEPDEIASLAVYLASDSAGAINGQSINVCGGKVFS